MQPGFFIEMLHVVILKLHFPAVKRHLHSTFLEVQLQIIIKKFYRMKWIVLLIYHIHK